MTCTLLILVIMTRVITCQQLTIVIKIECVVVTSALILDLIVPVDFAPSILSMMIHPDIAAYIQMNAAPLSRRMGILMLSAVLVTLYPCTRTAATQTGVSSVTTPTKTA